jgi:hypothetical protein
MTEAKDDDLLPQTSPEIIRVLSEQDETARDSADDKQQPAQEDREGSEAGEK